MLLRSVISVVLFLCVCDGTACAQTQNSAELLWQKRDKLAQEFGSQLKPILEQCGQDQRTALQRELLIRRDPKRTYVFLAPVTRLKNNHGIPENTFEQLKQARSQYSQKLFELAQAQAEQKNASMAFQLLHEAIYYDPDHAQLRKILGHRLTDDQKNWHVASGRLRIRKASRAHPEFKWPRGEYYLCSTSHFEIASQANETETEQLARKLEQWHGIWRQVFFDYWSNPGTLVRWIDGKGSVRIPSRKFKVIFFKNEQQYIETLSTRVPGIQGSSGYYDDREKMSFFFAGDRTVEDTWRHELTHQLFSETTRTVKSPFESQFLWLGEGIAMYFESLTQHDGFVTLGGFDSRRLQYARRRYIKEQYFVPIKTLSAASQKEFQTHPDRAKIYSQSAGVAHFLMNSSYGNLQRPLSGFLKLCYQGKLKKDAFAKSLGISYEELDKQYQAFLLVQTGEIERWLKSSLSRTEFAFPATKLSAGDFQALGACENLLWLDLSATQIDDSTFHHLKTCRNLEQIFLSK